MGVLWYMYASLPVRREALPERGRSLMQFNVFKWPIPIRYVMSDIYYAFLYPRRHRVTNNRCNHKRPLSKRAPLNHIVMEIACLLGFGDDNSF